MDNFTPTRADLTPITAAEVEDWFRSAVKDGTMPNAASCKVIADMMCNWQPGGWRHSMALDGLSPERILERKEWDAAAKTLLSLVASRRQKMDELGTMHVPLLASMNAIETSLSEAGHWFGSGPKQGLHGVLWHQPAFVILKYAGGVISGGVSSRTSPVVVFTKSALDRLGFMEATPSAIADLNRHRSKKGKNG